jgi:hypothetical protein
MTKSWRLRARRMFLGGLRMVDVVIWRLRAGCLFIGGLCMVDAVMVFLRWCSCDGILVLVFLRWCSCDGILVLVFLCWCSCVGVLVLVFLCWRFCVVSQGRRKWRQSWQEMLKAAAKTTESDRKLGKEPLLLPVGKSRMPKKERRVWSCSLYVEMCCAKTQYWLLRSLLVSISVSESK